MIFMFFIINIICQSNFAILKNEINHINTEKIEFDYCVRNVNRYPSKFIIVILLYLFRYCQANMAIYLIKIHIIIFFVLFNILFFIFSFFIWLIFKHFLISYYIKRRTLTGPASDILYIMYCQN